MKRFVLMLGLVVLGMYVGVFSVLAQEKELSWEDKYSDRPVAYLLYESQIEINEDWSSTHKRHFKIKIQKEEGKDWGEIPIYYNKSKQEVIDVDAYTITPDGKKHNYSKIQEFHVYEGYPMYSDSMVKIITMPEVVIGSTIEYELTVLTKGMPIPNQFWDCIYLGSGKPIKEYKSTITFPKKLGIQYKEFNVKDKPNIEENDTTIRYSWDIRDIDEEEYDEFMPPPNLENVTSCAEFSSIPSWDVVADWYYGLVQKNMTSIPEIENKAKELAENKETIKDKVRAILEYIQDNFRYVSMSLDEHTFEPHPTDETFRNKYGDCKDLSLLCKAMLKAVGIEANMALFEEEFRITDPQYDLPYPTLFDHVVLEIEDPEGNFYVDPLLDGYDIGEYPGAYQAAYTFIITQAGGRFGRFPEFDERRLGKSLNSVIEIKEDGSAVITVVSLWDLDFSIKMRQDWKSMSQKLRDEFLQRLDAYITTGGRMIKRSWENIDATYGRIKSYTKYEKPDAYPISGDMIIISSGSYSRGYDFSKEKRENPIFYPGNALEEEITTYIIPEGFELMHVPKDLDLDIGFFGVKRNYEVDGNKLTLKEVTRYTRKELPADKYQEVQDFFNKLPRKTNQRIIMRKITE